MTPPARPLKDLFLAALAVAPADRPAWLDRECADPGRRDQLRRMLAAHDAPHSLLEPAGDLPAGPSGADPWATSDLPAPRPDPGNEIGPYRLLEPLGEGGFGVVYLAEQTAPVRRKVALKVLKPGMDSKQVVARFEAERQALALMDHPHIAQVFDGGTAPDGQPYFVMELVRGVPITDFCDRHQLAPRDRLGLFVQVCQAVQHAHQKGVIHRDLKPSNVLVSRHDTTPVVKVIDFGVAKALGQTLTDKTVFTGVAQMVGTPLYMSPEQAGMSDLDVDTRSDVYSLGVLLYELLTGSTPFPRERFRKAAYDEIRRIIREEEPPKPSTRLSDSRDALPSVAAQRHTGPARLTRMVRGELDWIVMKALEKDRNRRYESAAGFALDVQRYLADEPVLACPPSTGYRLRKFARKNRGPLGVAAAFLLLLTAGAIASTWQAVRATVAERAADGRKREADDAKRQAEERGDSLAALNATLRRAKYIADTNLAQHAWEANNLVRTHQLLDRYRPGPGEADLRGFEWFYLNRMVHAERWAVKANAGFVTSAAFTPDGKSLYSFGKDRQPQRPGDFTEELPGEVKVWNAATGRQLPLDLRLPTNKIRRIALNPSGTHLAASFLDHGFRIWDLATGQSIALEVPGSEHAYDLGFSPDGKLLVTLSVLGADDAAAGIVRVWDLGTRKPVVTLDKEMSLFVAPGFSPDGKFLAVPTFLTGHVRVIDSATGREAFTCKSGDVQIMQAVFSPDGKSLAGCGQRGVHIWDVSTREKRATFPSAAHMGLVLAYSPEGRRLAVGSIEGLIELWDTGTDQILRTFKGHGGEIRRVAFSPDGTLLVSAGADGTLRAWDISERRDTVPIFQQPARIGDSLFSPDGQTLLVGSLDERRWYLVDAVTGQQRGEPIKINQQSDNYSGWSPDGKHLVSTGPDKTIAMHDTASGARIREFRVDAGAECVTDLSPDGRWLAYSAPEGTIKILDAQTGEERRSIRGLTAACHNLALSPDGTRLAGADLAGWVRVWDAASGRETMSVQVTGMYVLRIRFSPDGKRLALVGNNLVLRSGEARILNTEDGREVAQLRGHTILVNDVDFHPDGQSVVTCSGDRTIRIWDLPTGQEILTLKGHTDGLNGIRFLPGGRQLRSASRDGTIRVWDARPLPD